MKKVNDVIRESTPEKETPYELNCLKEENEALKNKINQLSNALNNLYSLYNDLIQKYINN